MAAELRWLVSACDAPAPARPVTGLVLTPRPPATAARAPETPAQEPASPVAPFLRGGGGIAPPAGSEPAAAPGEGGPYELVMLGAFGVALVLWMQWHLVGRRSAAKRYPCSVPVRLRLRDTVEDTRLEDISRYGARIRLRSVRVEAGDTVEVACAHFTRAGRVQWANVHYAGVRFRAPLPDGTLEACLTEDAAGYSTAAAASARAGGAP